MHPIHTVRNRDRPDTQYLNFSTASWIFIYLTTNLTKYGADA